MKKNIVILGMIWCLSILLSGCGVSLKSVAIKEAKDYIKEKYGINAKVTDVKKHYTEGMFSMASDGKYLVMMQDGDKEFGVFLTATDPDTAKDNYQADEITQALSDEIAELVGAEPYYSRLIYDYGTFDEFDRQYDNYFSDYYDGANLYTVLNWWSGKITLAYIDGTPVRDVDLSSIGEKFTESLDDDSSRYLIINLYSFNSVDDFDKDSEKVCEREFYMSPYELNRALPDLYDAQFYRYQQPSYHAARICYSNNSFGYEYDCSDDEYRYFGEGY